MASPALGGRKGYVELLADLRPIIAPGAAFDRPDPPFVGAQLLLEGRCDAGKCVAHEDAGGAQEVLDEWERR